MLFLLFVIQLRLIEGDMYIESDKHMHALRLSYVLSFTSYNINCVQETCSGTKELILSDFDIGDTKDTCGK